MMKDDYSKLKERAGHYGECGRPRSTRGMRVPAHVDRESKPDFLVDVINR